MVLVHSDSDDQSITGTPFLYRRFCVIYFFLKQYIYLCTGIVCLFHFYRYLFCWYSSGEYMEVIGGVLDIVGLEGYGGGGRPVG